ncbi:MAG TPA: hypothetical protein VFZ08_03940 [Terriglobia bacterium]|nr:hypothetical protein [Terriglobia bacterium]
MRTFAVVATARILCRGLVRELKTHGTNTVPWLPGCPLLSEPAIIAHLVLAAIYDRAGVAQGSYFNPAAFPLPCHKNSNSRNVKMRTLRYVALGLKP